MIAITLGEPAGIGLELVAQLAKEQALTDCVLVGDRQLIKSELPQWPDQLINHTPLKVKPELGKPNPNNSQYVLNTIKVAVKGCLDGDYQAIVTCPIHKGVINDAGIPFTGHTEYLASLTNTKQVVMMLLNEFMRVALVTTHLPLRNVVEQITSSRIIETTRIVNLEMTRKFGINSPHIAVCGLNPHAGENGHIGHEEQEIIVPALTILQKEGLNVSGPHPADTLFTPDKLKTVDAVIAMYHDQGLVPLKYAGFGTSVNITLGLPIIRTSVDHGTAFDIVGQKIASSKSLYAAIQCAKKCIEYAV